ncbi:MULTISPECIES: ABC transporter ATP-binding protein [unclassified Paraburkholderia]|uniref:ABC transporter ATP-binding protein n=1 Tax=unclassified Paraburkholderia TaxID=2615204 RepID=UPI002AB096D5|nr:MULTISPECIES: ABC transporter ATP-binding protein [unclassified Paraburkholderia]
MTTTRHDIDSDDAENPCINVAGLHVKLPGTFALTIPDFRLYRGERVAIIGPNGSGKSTFIECLLGARIVPDAQISLFGSRRPRLDESLRARLGVQMQNAGFNDLYRVKDLYRLHKRMYAVSSDEVFEAFGVPQLFGKRFGVLSSGERQRVQLALAMAHVPELMIFDEPTSNLDPHYEAVFRANVRDAARANPDMACLFITHTAAVMAESTGVLRLVGGRVDRAGSLETVIEADFGAFACLFSGDEDALREADAVLAEHPSLVRRATREQSIAYFGGIALRDAAAKLAAMARFTNVRMWQPAAADLLEGSSHA